MPRASKEDAARHRQEIITAAARLFRERGLNGVSVPELMEAVGLTHGGFYKHFASKDELISLAVTEAFGQSHELVEKLRHDRDDDNTATREAYIDFYLSHQHLANPGAGCVNAALCSEIGRAGRKDPIHGTYAKNLAKAMDGLSRMMPERDPAEARKAAIETQAMLVGALVMARASQGSAISDEILATVRAKLLADKH
ncbi:MAG TPA: TetR/AcrR family transcriptional regulator [Dongiaceae bacterium]|nr:TetR/AcrR family transcriptional regulator [Dongiaceae bacterium]